MAAIIETTLYEWSGGPVIPGSTVTGASRDDLRRPYEVFCHSVDPGVTYAWTLSFTPSSPGSVGLATPNEGTPSAATLTAPAARDTTFVVDFEGSYLLNLVVDLGLPSESTQSVRLRRLTNFGKIKLVASGERRDVTGVIPVDVSVDGWALDQNQNLQRLMLMVRRGMTSGRVVFVDANRGRDNTNTPNDPAVLVDLPGGDPSALEATGTKLAAEGFADFSTIGAGITYAAAAVARGEAAPSSAQPYFVVIQPGVYDEDLVLLPHIHLIGNCAPPDLFYNMTLTAYEINASVLIRSVGAASHTFTAAAGFNDQVTLVNLGFTDAVARTDSLWNFVGGKTTFKDCVFWETGAHANQGSIILTDSATHGTKITLSHCRLYKEGLGEPVIRFNSVLSELDVIEHSIVSQSGSVDGIWFNEQLRATTLLLIQDSEVSGSLLGVGFCGDFLRCTRSFISGVNALTIAALVAPGPKAGVMDMVLQDSQLLGAVNFDSNLCGTTSLLYRNTFGTTAADIALTLVGGGASPTAFGPLGVFPVNYKQVGNVGSPHQLILSDEIVGCLSNTGVVSVILPMPQAGHRVTIKDEGGAAFTSNITITPMAATIDGGPNLILNVNFAAATLYYNGTNWFVI
jgi:hypothetical protein